MCLSNAFQVAQFAESRLVFRAFPESQPEIRMPPAPELKIRKEVQDALGKLSQSVGKAKEQGREMTRSADLEKKDALRMTLIKKGASYDALLAFGEAYDPKGAPTIKKIIEDTKPWLDIKDPESWEYIHRILANPNNETYFSQAYYDIVNPELVPLVPEERILNFPEKTLVARRPKKVPQPEVEISSTEPVIRPARERLAEEQRAIAAKAPRKPALPSDAITRKELRK